MAKKKKEKVEYRYYEMPADSHILALTGRKWIQTYRRTVDYLHLHNYMEIGYCYYGTGQLVLEDKVYDYSGGHFSVIPAGVLHTTNSTPETVSRWEYLFLDVDAFLEEFFPGKSNYRTQLLSRINARAQYLSVREAPVLGYLIQNILNEMSHKRELYKDSVTGAVRQVLVEIARMNPGELRGAKPVEWRQNSLKGALEYIHINYTSEIKIKELAEVCCVSETHFRRLFMEKMHTTPVEYINRTRIHAACELLRKTEDPIMEVSQKVGYSTLSTFNRNFKKYIGTTPYEWRARPENYEQKLLEYAMKWEEGW